LTHGHYAAGERLSLPFSSNKIFFICRGAVARFHGRNRTKKRLDILRAGDWVQAGCRCQEACYCELKALTDAVSGWWVPNGSEWEERVLAQKEVSMAFWQRSQERRWERDEWDEVWMTRSVRGRLAWWILRLAEWFGQAEKHGGTQISLQLTQTDLAALVRATRPLVHQALRKFVERGWLIWTSHQIVIWDKKALAEESREGWKRHQKNNQIVKDSSELQTSAYCRMPTHTARKL
jgi:CRP-like cAMP-binding protein